MIKFYVSTLLIFLSTLPVYAQTAQEAQQEINTATWAIQSLHTATFQLEERQVSVSTRRNDLYVDWTYKEEHMLPEDSQSVITLLDQAATNVTDVNSCVSNANAREADAWYYRDEAVRKYDAGDYVGAYESANIAFGKAGLGTGHVVQGNELLDDATQYLDLAETCLETYP